MAQRLDDNGLTALAAPTAAAVDGDEVVRLTRALVCIPSVCHPGDAARSEAAVATFVAGYLRDRGFSVSAHDAAPGRPNVVADWHRHRAGRGLILEGHTDVVTEGDHGTWSHPPFDGVVKDGRIYGRGAADMKGGLAAAIVAADAVRRAAPDLPGRVRIAALADEEGMMLGVKAFVREGHASGFDAAIVCEPEENEICLHQKGAVRILVTIRGRMSHGAMPYAGINPIPLAARFVAAVGEEEAKAQQRHGAHPLLGLPYLTPTTVRAPVWGEPQFNVMAGEAQVTVDVRTIPGQSHEDIRAALQAAADRIKAAEPRAEIALEVIEDRPWTETSPDAPIVRAVERAVRQVTGHEPRYGGVPGATDGTFLHAWAHMPVVVMGPGSRTIPHQADEHVAVADLIEAARVYAAAIVHFLGDA